MTQRITEARKEATNVLYGEDKKPVAVIIRDDQSRHAVVYRIEELCADEVAELFAKPEQPKKP